MITMLNETVIDWKLCMGLNISMLVLGGFYIWLTSQPFSTNYVNPTGGQNRNMFMLEIMSYGI